MVIAKKTMILSIMNNCFPFCFHPGDGLEIFNDHNSKIYRLLIREAVAEDAGIYKVKAVNVAGKAETSGALSVAGTTIRQSFLSNNIRCFYSDYFKRLKRLQDNLEVYLMYTMVQNSQKSRLNPEY